MAAARPVSLLLLCLILLKSPSIFSFQSDELQDEDEDWGIVGSPNIEQVTARPSRRPNAPSSDGGPAAAASSDTKVLFQLEHSFGDSDFSPAGAFSARLRNLHHGGQTLTKLRLSRNAFTTEEQEAFAALVKADGFYRIRVPANVLSPGQESILSSVKARCLAGSNLQERFDFYMDRGNVIAVGYGASECAYPRNLRYPTKWGFDSHIVMKSGEQAVRSPTINNDVEVELGEDGQPKKPLEKSFWGKYWMYIVPLGLIILNAVTQVANMPDESASQGGAQGASQRAVNAGPRRR